MNIHSDKPVVDSNEVLTIRGRKVAYSCTNWGADLRAMERGYFPISHTGYRSIGCGSTASTPSQEILENLALENDRETKALLSGCNRALARLQGDSLSRYLHVSHYAESAIDRGFFARDEDRILLWQHAYRLLRAIADTPALHPRPTNAAWNAEHCARVIERTHLTIPWVASLLAGEITAFPENGAGKLSRHYMALVYLELPPRTTPEPTGSVPPIAQDFAFSAALEPDLPDHEEEQTDHADDEFADDGEPSPTPDVAELETVEVAQLELF